MVFKSIISVVCSCLTILPFNVSATTTYVNADGQITGVTRLDIDGEEWDIALHNLNSFTSVYASYPTASAHDRDFTIDVSLALSGFLTSDIPPFAVETNAFLGCSDQVECLINSAYDYDPIADVVWGDAVYARGSTTITFRPINFNYGAWREPEFITYATWGRSEPVPKPSIAIALASGLVVLGVARRKVRT